MVWMVSILSLVSSFSCLFSSSLGTVQSAPTTIHITDTFKLYSFFCSRTRSRYLPILIPFIFTLWSAEIVKFNRWQVLFFLLINTRSCLLTGIRWSVCISKSQRILCVSFSRTDSGSWIYHLSVWSCFNLLHNSLWITFSTHSYLVLYDFCASTLHFSSSKIIVSNNFQKLYLLNK